MNMISTGTFLNGMDASNKQSELVKKLVAAWEKKNSKAARAGGVSLMALSLAACGGEDTTPFAQSDIDAATAPLTAAVAAAETALTAAQADAAGALVAQLAAETQAAEALVAASAAQADAAAATVAGAAASAQAAAAVVAQAAAEASLATAEAALATANAEKATLQTSYDALVASNATLQTSYDALIAPKSLTFAATTAETLNGGSGNDTFSGSGTFFTNADKIRDTSSDDNDTANLTVTAASTPDISGVENVNVTMNSVGGLTLTASSMTGVNNLTVTRGDLVVGGSTIAGNKAVDINSMNASDVAAVTVGGTATTVNVDQTVVAGATINADAATGNVTIIGAATVNAAGAGLGDTVTVTAGDNDGGLFVGVGAVQNAKAVTVNTGASDVVIASDVATNTDVFTGAINITAAAATDVSVAAASGGGSITALGESGTLGTNGITVAGVDASGFSVTTSYVGTSTLNGLIQVEGTGTAGQTDVATLSAAGIQSVNLNQIETVNLSGNGQAVTYDIAAASDVTTYAASGAHAVTLRGDLTEFTATTITGVSALDIDGGTAAAINLGLMDATTTVDLGVNNTGNAVTVKSGTAITVTSDQTTDLQFSFPATSTAFDVSVTAGDDNGTSTAVGTIDVTTFRVDGSATVAGTVTLDATVANFNAATSTVLGAAQTLVITGDEDVTLGDVTAASVNAAASSGIINMTAAANVANVTTGSGADDVTLNSATTVHTLDTGAGIDNITITATETGSLILGNAGNDTINASEAGKAYVVNAGDGDDTVTLADVNATVVGGAGSDTLDLDGTLDLSTATANTNELLAISGFENWDLTDTGAQTITLRAATFAGNNTFKVDTDNAGDTITVNAVAAGSTIDASGVTKVATDTVVINLNGGAGSDTITGGVIGENFVQTAGADSIEGGSTGTDTLTALAAGSTVGTTGTTSTGAVINLGATAVSAATIVGDTGNYISGNLTEIGAGKAGYLFNASSTLNSGDLDSLGGIENVTGTAAPDYIVGSAGNNTITTGGGADTIVAGDGDDIIVVGVAAGVTTTTEIDGGLGSDKIQVTADNNATGAVFDDLSGIETIEVLVSATASDDAKVTLTSTAADTTAITITAANLTNSGSVFTLVASDAEVDGALTVTGSTGDDVITLGDGGGSITGGKGDDALSGHTGTDTFIFSSSFANNATDTITNFTSLTDKINLDALTTATAVTDVSAGAAKTFTTVADTVYFYSATDTGTALSVETESTVVTVGNAALTITSAAAGAYLVIVDQTESNTGIYQWTDATGNAELHAGELELLGTVATTLVASDFIFA